MNTRRSHSVRRGAAAALLGTALALVSITGLHAQEPAGAGLGTVQETYPQEVLERVRSILDRAAEAGLPDQALADKALEGAAKRVPGDRLVEALERRLDGLQRASEALGSGAGEASLRAGADAMRQGVSEEQVGRVGEVASSADRPAALVVLGELAAMGLPVDQAVEAVTAALEDGRGGGELLALGARARLAVERGATAEEALSRMRGGPPGFAPGLPGIGGMAAGPLSGPPVPPGAGPPGTPTGGGPPAGGPPGGIPGGG